MPRIKMVILASTSGYRAQLLARLKIPFSIVAPATDEAVIPGEHCRDTALRLAVNKARDGALKVSQPTATTVVDGVVIGSDQVADLDGQPLGKPGTRAVAREQLLAMRGKTIIFHTALALFDMASGRIHVQVVPTNVTMRSYTESQIDYYLDHEDALDCAGSAKSEGLGAALIANMTSDDPTALVGLPLIALTTMLATEGIEVLS